MIKKSGSRHEKSQEPSVCQKSQYFTRVKEFHLSFSLNDEVHFKCHFSRGLAFRPQKDPSSCLRNQKLCCTRKKKRLAKNSHRSGGGGGGEKETKKRSGVGFFYKRKSVYSLK